MSWKITGKPKRLHVCHIDLTLIPKKSPKHVRKYRIHGASGKAFNFSPLHEEKQSILPAWVRFCPLVSVEGRNLWVESCAGFWKRFCKGQWCKLEDLWANQWISNLCVFFWAYFFAFEASWRRWCLHCVYHYLFYGICVSLKRKRDFGYVPVRKSWPKSCFAHRYIPVGQHPVGPKTNVQVKRSNKFKQLYMSASSSLNPPTCAA